MVLWFLSDCCGGWRVWEELNGCVDGSVDKLVNNDIVDFLSFGELLSIELGIIWSVFFKSVCRVCRINII